MITLSYTITAPLYVWVLAITLPLIIVGLLSYIAVQLHYLNLTQYNKANKLTAIQEQTYAASKYLSKILSVEEKALGAIASYTNTQQPHRVNSDQQEYIFQVQNFLEKRGYNDGFEVADILKHYEAGMTVAYCAQQIMKEDGQ